MPARIRRDPKPAVRVVAALLLALTAWAAAAQAPATQDSPCARPASRPLTLTRPFLPSPDTVTLLTGELVANASDGRGSLTIEYLTRAAPLDTAGLAREAASLARAVTPYTGSTPFAVLTVRACRPGADGRASATAGTFTFAQVAGGEWQLAPP